MNRQVMNSNSVKAVNQEQLCTEELLVAIARRDMNEVQRCVEYSAADLNTHDEGYNNILHYAVMAEELEIVRYLVECVGLNYLEANYEGETPFDLARKLGASDILQYFETKIGCAYEETYHNPVRHGFFPDPSIVRVGEDYYMVNSTFVYFPCIPVSHSRDLVHWRIIGYAVAEPEYAAELENLNGGMGYWAPDISYDGKKFYVTATLRCNDEMEKRRIQMITSSALPEGPYEKPVFLDEGGIDPSIFHDTDGRKYMLLNKGARIMELDSECKRLLSPGKMLWYGDNKRKPEGPHMLKHNGYYYLFLAEGGTGMGHQITVARSREMMGPYEPCPYNPILHQWNKGALIQCCGHGKPVQLSNGEWAIVYLCMRKWDRQYGILGRETALDPLVWTADGWPLINCGRGPSDQQRLSIPADAKSRYGAPLGGYPQWKKQDWMTPRPLPFNCIGVTGDSLKLRGSKVDLNSKACRSVLLIRQTDFMFEAVCEFVIPALSEGESIGLACYYDENSYIKYGVCKESGTLRILLQEYVGRHYRTINMDTILEDEVCVGATFSCKVKTEGLRRTLSYLNQGSWVETETFSDTSYLSSEGLAIGKRFTGAMVGLYVHGDFEGCFTEWQYHEF